MRTADEIQAAQDALIQGAEGRDLTEDEMTSYTELETELGNRRAQDAIRAQHAAARRAVTAAVHTGAAPRQDETLERAFDHYLRTGKENADIQELRAQNEGTGSAGGFLVPDRFRQKLQERLKGFGGLASVVDEFPTSDGAPVNWPTVDDTANLGEIVAEGGTFSSGADIVMGEATLGAYKYMAGGAGSTPLRVSWELLQDSAFDIEALVTRLLGTRIARIQAQHIVRGSGVGEPLGIVTGRTPVQTAANTAITYADLLTWVHSVDISYRENGRWAFNDQTLAYLRGIVDGNGRPLLTDATNGIENNPGGARLLGYPVTIDQAFADYDADDSTDHFGVFGDLVAGYVVRRVKDVTVVVDPYTRAANGQVQYTVWARMDATQQDTNAYSVLSGKS